MTITDLIRQADTDGRFLVDVRIEAQAHDGKNVILEYRPGAVVSFRVQHHGRRVYRGVDEDEAIKVFLEITGIEEEKS